MSAICPHFCANVWLNVPLVPFQRFQGLPPQDKDLLLRGRKCRRHVPVSERGFDSHAVKLTQSHDCGQQSNCCQWLGIEPPPTSAPLHSPPSYPPSIGPPTLLQTEQFWQGPHTDTGACTHSHTSTHTHRPKDLIVLLCVTTPSSLPQVAESSQHGGGSLFRAGENSPGPRWD